MQKKQKQALWTVIIVVVLAIIIWLISGASNAEGKYDTFNQCLAEENTTFYGAFWCPACQEQKALFGKSKNTLPYVECSTPNRQGQTEVCIDAEIQSYPTWEFADGSRQIGVMTPAELSEKTGCELPAEE